MSALKALSFLVVIAGGSAAMAQDAGLPDREETREYVGPRDDSYMLLQGRITQLEGRMDAAEEAIRALVSKLDANALKDRELLNLLVSAGVLRRQR